MEALHTGQSQERSFWLYNRAPKSPNLSQASCTAEEGVTRKEGEEKVGKLETGMDTARLPELD